MKLHAMTGLTIMARLGTFSGYLHQFPASYSHVQKTCPFMPHSYQHLATLLLLSTNLLVQEV